MSKPSRKTVIVTRPKDRFDGTADLLKVAGFHPISVPILTPKPVEPKWPKDVPASYVFTSARSFDYLNKAAMDAQKPYLCVGEKTKAAAIEFGFTDCRGCFEDVDALCHAINSCDQVADTEVIWHIGGKHTEGLSVKCIHRHVCVYDMVARDALNDEECQILSSESPAAVLFYSVRTAQHFERCVRVAGLEKQLINTKALCISKNVANCLDFNLWSDIIAAELKTESAVIEALTRTA